MKKILLAVLLVFPAHLLALDAEPVKTEKLIKTTQSWDGSTLPYYSEGQPEITILKITIQPNMELAWHTHPTINAGVLVKGEMTVISKSGEVTKLTAGDAIIGVVDKIHRGVNNGSEPAEIIAFYAGVEQIPLTINVD